MSRTPSPNARPVYVGPSDAVEVRVDDEFGHATYVTVAQGEPCPEGIDVATLSADWAAPTPTAPVAPRAVDEGESK